MTAEGHEFFDLPDTYYNAQLRNAHVCLFEQQRFPFGAAQM